MPLSNSQYNQIMRDYDAQQLLDRQIEVQRTEELYRKLPQLKEIDQKIADVSLEVAMEMIESGHSERLDQEVDRRVRLLVDEKQALMKANGFPEDFLQIPYRCPDCKDTGYIQGKKCHCFRQAEINLVYHNWLRSVNLALEMKRSQNLSAKWHTSNAAKSSSPRSTISARS